MGEAEWRPLPERLEMGAKRKMPVPVPVTKTETERYLVLDQSADRGGRTVTYWRVPNADRKADLERQAGRLVTPATGLGLAIADVVTEDGSGLNGNRPKPARLPRDPSVSAIVIEHLDRLARFVLEHLSAALKASGCRILVIEDAEVDDDLARDMTDALTSFCARLCRRRSAARRAKAALRAAREAA
ncbi:IS607 family transposase [Nonomuraea wenchangensis]